AETVFDSLRGKSEIIGLHLISENDLILGLSICNSDKNIYFIKSTDMITKDYLINQVLDLRKHAKTLSVIGLKPQLTFLPFTVSDGIYDCAIAAYLLNPLTDTYHYDDIARDYFNMTLPSRGDLLGKSSLTEALQKNEEAFLNFACYSAYVAYLGPDKLTELLKDAD